MDEIVEFLTQTFEAKDISSNDRKKLLQMIDKANLDRHDLAFVRSRIFDLANGALENGNSSSILYWLEKANKILVPDEEGNQLHELFFSPGQECLQAINSRLRKARRFIKVCVFTISDDRISSTLLDCHKRGIDVRVISDNEKLFDLGSDIERLASEGVNVRVDQSPYHMHHKFAVIDDEIAITGSYNWTRSAAQHNVENILVTDNPKVVDAFKKEFGKLWPNMEEVFRGK